MSIATYCMQLSSVKWSVLAHFEFQPRGQNFQAKSSGVF